MTTAGYPLIDHPSAWQAADVASPATWIATLPGAVRDEIQAVAGLTSAQSNDAIAERSIDRAALPSATTWLAPIEREIVQGRGGMTPDGARRLLTVALTHPQVKMVVSALGSPPPDIIEQLRSRGIVIGAMCGKAEHAARHMKAGVEVIVAQGTEAGGHTGEIATMVLVPQVVEACGPGIAVLAAGGIARGSQIAAALALGAQGVWCGTVWLGTRESELDPFEKQVLFDARADDAVRRKARTGKSVRMIKSRLSEAWEQPGAPKYLPTPLQGILYNEMHARVVRAKRKDFYSGPAGQVVGMLTEETSVRDVMYRMQTEYLEAVERLQQLTDTQQ